MAQWPNVMAAARGATYISRRHGFFVRIEVVRGARACSHRNSCGVRCAWADQGASGRRADWRTGARMARCRRVRHHRRAPSHRESRPALPLPQCQRARRGRDELRVKPAGRRRGGTVRAAPAARCGGSGGARDTRRRDEPHAITQHAGLFFLYSTCSSASCFHAASAGKSSASARGAPKRPRGSDATSPRELV
jgi:hypothetical protein